MRPSDYGTWPIILRHQNQQEVQSLQRPHWVTVAETIHTLPNQSSTLPNFPCSLLPPRCAELELDLLPLKDDL
jgi:hypothetical protein